LLARRKRPSRTMIDIGEFSWRFAVLVAVVVALSLATGFVHWDPKMPAWFLLWAWSMLFLTVLPEEALFRGVVQTSIRRRLGGGMRATIAAIAIAGLLFGLAHAGGGTTYVVLAAVAGFGYGWIYSAEQSLAAAMAAHFGLNVIHFLLFTYPALALHV
jgi:membrane protease YdiL (CAAX protease family)